MLGQIRCGLAACGDRATRCPVTHIHTLEDMYIYIACKHTQNTTTHTLSPAYKCGGTLAGRQWNKT